MQFITMNTDELIIKYISNLEDKIRLYNLDPLYMYIMPCPQKYIDTNIETLWIIYKYCYDTLKYCKYDEYEYNPKSNELEVMTKHDSLIAQYKENHLYYNFD